jgi:hypothetical protein
MSASGALFDIMKLNDVSRGIVAVRRRADIQGSAGLGGKI